MRYAFARRWLFRLPAETSHDLSLKSLKVAHQSRLLPLFCPPKVQDPVELMGLTFANRIGLAAGLDKNADYVDALADFGFGFLEVGTVTPRPQDGNPKPRLFRLPEQSAIINRMGFNNAGVDAMVARLKAKTFNGILGVNVGKNKDTPADKAAEDYIACIEKVYPYASYITVNISSPNTPGLRDLQFGDSLKEMLDQIKVAQARLGQQHGRLVPVVVKIAPDMSEEEIALVGSTIKTFGMDGIIATNTTLSRVGVEGLDNAREQGGLSGAPLTNRATHVVEVLRSVVGSEMPIIASGGVMSAADAQAKMDAGADLVQIYSGLIYHGPRLVNEAARALVR